MKKLLLIFAFFFFFGLCLYPETIRLKSGSEINTDIIERGTDYLKVDFEGITLTYSLDEIESIDGVTVSQPTQAAPSLTPQTASSTDALPSETKDAIRSILEDFRYPPESLPALEQELSAFLIKIDFPKLKQQARQAKSSPAELKGFLETIRGLFEQQGCLDSQQPRPLMKLLVNSFGREDILQVIEASPISPQEKEEAKREKFSCTAVSQLGSIVLGLLDIDVRVAYSRGGYFSVRHVFNFIPLNDQEILFADFLNGIFEVVDIDRYYQRAGKYMPLKQEYRLDPDTVRTIIEEGRRGLLPNSQEEILNVNLNDLYFYLYLSDDNSATAGIYNNRGKAYTDKGDFDRAIADFNQALGINPNYVEAYSNRGGAYQKKGDFDQAMADYNQALMISSNSAEAYYNRGSAYYEKGNLDQAMADFNQALVIDPNYAGTYYARGTVYMDKGDFDQAMADYNQALMISSNSAEAYYNRGSAYYEKGNLDQAMADFNQALVIDPNYAGTYYARGTVYMDKGDLDQAMADFNQALRINPNDTNAYGNRGNVYAMKGDFDRAIADYNQALGINPSLAGAYNNRALAYFSKGDYQQAWEDVYKAQALGYEVSPEFLQDLRRASGEE